MRHKNVLLICELIRNHNFFIYEITDVPSQPRNLEVFDIFKTSCKLKWEVPEDNGGSPILHYIVERQDLALKGIKYKYSYMQYLCINQFFFYSLLMIRRLAKRWRG